MCNYSTKVGNILRRLIFTRDKSLLTKYNLQQYLNNNTYINDLFKWEDPNLVSEILLNELHIIINAIAPKKRIQVKNDYCPFLTKDLKTAIKERDNLLLIAKTSRNITDYINFKNKRNAVDKEFKQKKHKYYNNILGKNNNNDYDSILNIDTPIEASRKLWKTVKEYTKTNKHSTPNTIIYNTKTINKPKELAQLSCKFFIDKITKIQNNFNLVI